MLCLCVRLSPWGGGAPLTTRHIILQDMLAITGGYIGAVNIPEKWFPGKCDTLCNSHHIMHVLVVAAVYHMHKAAEMDLVWMSQNETCVRPDSYNASYLNGSSSGWAHNTGVETFSLHSRQPDICD